MRVIIAGSRDIADLSLVDKAMKESGFKPELVLSGCARGVDKLGEMWAARRSIPVRLFPAEWNKYGRGAGKKRNSQMVENADALVAIWDGKSSGTLDTIKKARWCGLKVYVLNVGSSDAERLFDSEDRRSPADGGSVRPGSAEPGDGT